MIKPNESFDFFYTTKNACRFKGKGMPYLLIYIFLFFFQCKSFAHNDQDPAEFWTREFYTKFIQYQKSTSTQTTPHLESQSYLKVWGQTLPLNSQFYELLRYSLHSVASGYNDFCDTCLIEEIKTKSKDPHWVTRIENKLNALTEIRAEISGIKQEYGNMALVGYVMMEVLEHTFLGPLGVCPILNVIYFSSLDTFKSMGQVFKYSRDFKTFGLPSFTQSLSAGLKIFILKRQALKVTYQFNPQARSTCQASPSSSLSAQHIHNKFKKYFFWQKDEINQIKVSKKQYVKLSKQQKRKRWLYWQTELQKQYSRRLLWPIAYQELVLNPNLDKISNQNKSDSDYESFDIRQDLKFIFSVQEHPYQRFLTALYVQEYFYIFKKMMHFLLQEDLESGQISRQQYLETHRLLVNIQSLQVELSNYLITVSQINQPQKLDQSYLRVQSALESQLGLGLILEQWLNLGDSFNFDEWRVIQNQLKDWNSQNLANRPWRQPKVTLTERIKTCGQWLNR